MDDIDGLPEPPVAVRTAGEGGGRAHASSPGTRQGDWLLLVLTDGRGEYRSARGSYALAAGMAGLIDPADPGMLLSATDEPYRYRYCRFSGAYAGAWAASLRQRLGAPVAPHPAAAEIADLLRRMGRWHAFDLPRRIGRREILLLDALRLLSADESAATPPAANAEAISAYLEERLDQPSDVQAMARHFGMSASGLCRAVRRLCGAPPQRLHEELKMDWATRLLAQPDLAIAAVATRLGYADPLYFSRVFKRHHGCSPRAWREST